MLKLNSQPCLLLSSSPYNVCDLNKHEKLGIHAARVGRLLPNSSKGRQPPVGDNSIFEISRLVTIRQPPIDGQCSF